MPTVVLANEHALTRAGMACLLSQEPEFIVVGEAADGNEAIRLVERLKPDLLVLDLMLPRLTGLEVLKQARRIRGTKSIVVSSDRDQGRVVQALKAGASAYVHTDSTVTELRTAIEEVLSGQCYTSASITQFAIDAALNRIGEPPGDAMINVTDRERQVLRLAAEGVSSAGIAARLFISRRTVETHRASLMKKLSLKSQTDLVRFAIRRDLIAP